MTGKPLTESQAELSTVRQLSSSTLFSVRRVASAKSGLLMRICATSFSERLSRAHE